MQCAVLAFCFKSTCLLFNSTVRYEFMKMKCMLHFLFSLQMCFPCIKSFTCGTLCYWGTPLFRSVLEWLFCSSFATGFWPTASMSASCSSLTCQVKCSIPFQYSTERRLLKTLNWLSGSVSDASAILKALPKV